MTAPLRHFPVAVLVLVLTGCGDAGVSGSERTEPFRTRPGAFAGQSEGREQRRRNPKPPGGRPIVPVRIEIPAIGVAAPSIRLGLNPDGTLEVPQDYSRTGWWAGGHRPGESGPAVIVGHVDSKTGPAVFFRLRELERGDRIEALDKANRSLTFEVGALEQHPKDDFPTERVYGDTARPTLRLITCGGDFDDSTGHYVENLIVYAELAR